MTTNTHPYKGYPFLCTISSISQAICTLQSQDLEPSHSSGCFAIPHMIIYKVSLFNKLAINAYSFLIFFKKQHQFI